MGKLLYEILKSLEITLLLMVVEYVLMNLVFIDDSEIVNNSASLDGGGIYQDNSNTFINNVEILNND